MQQFRRTRIVQVSLVGDFDATVTAHRAIPLALKRAGDDLDVDVRFTWHHTAQLGPRPERTLEASSGVWCVPASPYANTGAALAAIRFARERSRPFLGTCGGFQHALLEYAQNVLGMADATHAELDPSAPNPLIAPLSCALVEQVGAVSVAAGSRLAAAYGATAVVEEYHCRYGLAPSNERLLAEGPLRMVGRGAEGEVRAVELDGHPFFVATLFQPERAALKEKTPPLVRAFIEAAAESAV
jgi:CTP synthase (UTP-ammonia lyase)